VFADREKGIGVHFILVTGQYRPPPTNIDRTLFYKGWEVVTM